MSNRKSAYRDMDKYRITRNAQRNRYYSRTKGLYPPRPYTDEDDYQILNSSLTDMELSVLIKRSVGSIQTRRCELKKRLNRNKVV